MKRFKPVLISLTGIIALGLFSVLALLVYPKNSTLKRDIVASIPLFSPLKRDDIAQAIGRQRFFARHLSPAGLPITIKGKKYNAKLNLDPALQARVEDIFNQYNPDYAAFVAMDPITGHVLAMVDYSTAGHSDNLNLRATYPAASVFKVVTSAAALEEKKLQPQSMIAWTGSAGTLYKSNLKEKITRWTRYISVEEALAKSINTVFGKIAMSRLGHEALQKYANAFEFNQPIAFDMPLDTAAAVIPEDSFGLAESGSGYTTRQTLSPVLGAMLASSIINGGKMPEPQLVNEVFDESGSTVFRSKEKTISHPLDAETARALSMMMEHTILVGTAKKHYRDYNHHPLLSHLFIGAKTGTLSGFFPKGKYDWFVGFAQSSENPNKKFAFAALTINKEYWKIKSARVAREAIINYFGRKAAL